MFCSKCGAPIESERQKFCTKCGAPVVIPAAASKTEKASAPSKPTVQSQRLQQPKQPVQPKQEATEQKKEGKQEKEGKKKKGKAGKIVLIIVAVLLLILVILVAVKFLVLDRQELGSQNSDSGWSAVGNDKEEKKEMSEDDINAALKEKLDQVIDEKGDIRDHTFDARYSQEVTDAEGVTGALLYDVSGDGVTDLVVAYGKNHHLYADVYTVEDNEVVEKKEGLLGAGHFADSVGEQALGGVYLKKTDDGWILAADTWAVASMFADGECRSVKAVACKDHTYSDVADFEYEGSAAEDEEVAEGKEAAAKIGISNVSDPTGAAFFMVDQNVIMISAFHEEAFLKMAKDYRNISAGDCFGTFYMSSMTDSDYHEDTEKLPELLKQFKEFQKEFSEQREDADLENEDYILPQSSERKLTKEDLADIKDDKWLLKVARNEIFARYGRMFKEEKLQEYSDSKDWYEPIYEPDEFDEYMVSDLEMKNAKFIKEYEDKLN